MSMTFILILLSFLYDSEQPFNRCKKGGFFQPLGYTVFSTDYPANYTIPNVNFSHLEGFDLRFVD